MSIDTNVMPRTQIGLSEFISAPEKRKVPDHLLDTKIYTGKCDNEIFHCRPSAIHFQGFNAGGKYLQKLRIINVSSECQRMHVIPPSASDIFKIHYNKLDSLVPGMYLEVSVEFIPQENVYHHDCIRIHSKAAANLTVPIHAYLTMNVSSFPNRIHFKATQVGHSAVKKIPLKNDAAIDFGFQIVFIQNHSAFNIYPLSGVVPANNHIDILIKYSPNEYCTSCVNIQVIVSQFNCQPYHCSITGTSEPGIATKLKVKQIERTSREVVDPRTISPLGRSRTKKQLDAKLIKKVEEKEIVKSGIRFPLNLNGHSAVSYVLSQKPGKLRAKDAKEAVKVQANSTCTSKQMKEVIFDHLVSKNVGDEQRNQLRWGVKLGEASLTTLHLADILKQRSKAMKEYLVIKGDCDKTIEFVRSSHVIYQDKILRPANKQSLSQPTFDLYLNDDWQKRYMVMGRFVQAARKIIWISRATKSLKAINIYLDEWRCGHFKNTRKLYDESNKEQLIVEKVTLETIGTNIQPFSFPEYNHTNVKDDMAVDALDILPVRETAIITNTKVCMYDLKVPLQYKLLHYNAHPFSSGTHKYISKRLARKLRSGLEKEFTQAISLMSTELVELSKEKENDLPITNSKLIVPSCFLEPSVYHPLHIFNPMPGVHAHAEKLPYSEIDDDYSLSPLSRAMPKRLEREGVIPAVMNWKKFPSHGLVSMSTPSLYHVYVPRWSDPFGEELIPSNAPKLLNSLPTDDQLQLDEPCDVSDVVVPNMDMVSAEFIMMEDIVSNTEDSEISPSFSVSMTLPNTNNPQSKVGMVSREKVKEELNLYLHKQMSNLGDKLKSGVSRTKSKWALDDL